MSNKVAVGKAKKLIGQDINLNAAPPGYDSVGTFPIQSKVAIDNLCNRSLVNHQVRVPTSWRSILIRMIARRRWTNLWWTGRLLRRRNRPCLPYNLWQLRGRVIYLIATLLWCSSIGSLYNGFRLFRRISRAIYLIVDTYFALVMIHTYWPKLY